MRSSPSLGRTRWENSQERAAVALVTPQLLETPSPRHSGVEMVGLTEGTAGWADVLGLRQGKKGLCFLPESTRR